MGILLSVLLVACVSSYMNVKEQSPNFKDGEFQNWNNVKTHSFWDMTKARFSEDTARAEWPKWVKTKMDNHPLSKVSGDNIRVTFINHATFLIQTAELNILTDPVFSMRVSPVSFIGPKRVHNTGITLKKLPPIDIIIISHDHYDHLDLDSMQQLIKRDNPKIYLGLGVSQSIKNSKNIVEMDWWDNVQVTENLKLWFLDVQHNSGRSIVNRNTTLWGGFLLDINGKKIYFGGDSGYADHYQRAYKHFGAVDLAFLPIGAYAPRSMFKLVHMNPYEAVQAHLDLKAKLSIGMHYGTFQLTAESRMEPVELLEKAKSKAGVPPSAFITLQPGEPMDFNLN